MVLLDNVLDVFAFLRGPNGHKDHEDEAEARFLGELGSGLGLVLPDHPFSTLADGQDFTEDEEGDHCQSLDGVIHLVLIL